MIYETFSKLWDKYIGDKQTKSGMSQDTMTALIEYGQGNKTKIEAIRKMLGR